MFQRLPRISSALYRLLVTSSCCHSFTCPLVKNNKANWNSDSRVTHKQAGTRCRGGTLFTQILKPFWVSTCPRNSCPPTATGADAEPRAAGSESPSENPSRPTPKQLGGGESQCWARLSLPRGVPTAVWTAAAEAGSEPAPQPEQRRGQMTGKGHTTHTLTPSKSCRRRTWAQVF